MSRTQSLASREENLSQVIRCILNQYVISEVGFVKNVNSWDQEDLPLWRQHPEGINNIHECSWAECDTPSSFSSVLNPLVFLRAGNIFLLLRCSVGIGHPRGALFEGMHAKNWCAYGWLAGWFRSGAVHISH